MKTSVNKQIWEPDELSASVGSMTVPFITSSFQHLLYDVHGRELNEVGVRVTQEKEDSKLSGWCILTVVYADDTYLLWREAEMRTKVNAVEVMHESRLMKKSGGQCK